MLKYLWLGTVLSCTLGSGAASRESQAVSTSATPGASAVISTACGQGRRTRPSHARRIRRATLRFPYVGVWKQDQNDDSGGAGNKIEFTRDGRCFLENFDMRRTQVTYRVERITDHVAGYLVTFNVKDLWRGQEYTDEPHTDYLAYSLIDRNNGKMLVLRMTNGYRIHSRSKKRESLPAFALIVHSERHTTIRSTSAAQQSFRDGRVCERIPKQQVKTFFQDVASVDLPSFHAGHISDKSMIGFGIGLNALRHASRFKMISHGGSNARIASRYVDEAASKYFGKKVRHQAAGNWKYRNGFYSGDLSEFEFIAPLEIRNLQVSARGNGGFAATADVVDDFGEETILKRKMLFKMRGTASAPRLTLIEYQKAG